MCQLSAKRTLTIWVEGAHWTTSPLFIDRVNVPAKLENGIDGGTRFSVDVPRGSRKVEIRQSNGDVEWSLAIDEAKTHDVIDRLVAFGRTGHYASALSSLEALRARASAVEFGPIDAAIARMALKLGKVDQAGLAFRRSISAAQQEGRVADVVQDASALLWALVARQRRFSEARALLEEMRPFGDVYSEGRMLIDFGAGTLAATTADVRRALEKYRAAERLARRLAHTLVESATEDLASLLGRVGRAEEAVTLLQGLTTPKEPCARSRRLLNLAWALMERASRRETRRDAEISASVASAEAATRSCPEPHNRLLALINTAEYLLYFDDDPDVDRLVQEIKSTKPGRDVLLNSWRADVLGRSLLKKRQPANALAAFEDLARMARGADLLEEAFRGEVGAGRALLALGKRRSAIARLKTAQDVLETMLRAIPLAEGRGSFLGGHDDGVRTLVSALVEGGALREALRVARWARAAELAHAGRIGRLDHLAPEVRVRWDEALGRYQRIRSEIEHEAENDWTIPRASLAHLRVERQSRAEQARVALDAAYQLLVGSDGTRDLRLADPAPNEIGLVFFPGIHEWFTLVATQAGVAVHRIDGAAFASSSTASRVLAPLGSELATAQRVRVFPYGASDRVDWPAVLWQGRPLLATAQVEYGLDVPRQANPPPAMGTGSTALLVANPSGDLPAAIPETDAVSRALKGWQVTRFDGNGATREAVLSALSNSRLFHYAGHAQVGAQGLSSALLMKGNARIEMGDLLALPSVPDLVVLSACEAAGTALHHPSLMGLAQIFVAAGAQVAIAPNRPVSDLAAQSFAEAFYSSFADETLSQPLESIRAAFRRALLQVSGLQKAPGSERRRVAGWESFRLLVP